MRVSATPTWDWTTAGGRLCAVAAPVLAFPVWESPHAFVRYRLGSQPGRGQQRRRPVQQGGRRRASISRGRTRASSTRTRSLTLYADDDFKLKQVTDILTGKLTKRQVDVRSLKYGDVEKISGNKVKQAVTVRTGVEQELAKKIVKLLKDSKLKVQGSIQGDAVRVSGAKRDDLQSAIALVRKKRSPTSRCSIRISAISGNSTAQARSATSDCRVSAPTAGISAR